MRNQFRKSKTRHAVFFCILFLAIPLFAKDIPCVWADVERIIAVGDLHGDLQNFIVILRGTGVVDENLHWIAGKTHLVQIGDVMDRGPDARKILDLLMRLEKEAEEAGGKVHMLIGNHEEMNISGIAIDYEGYVSVEQFIDFLPDSFKERTEKKFIKKIEKSAAKEHNPNFSMDSLLKESWEEFLSEVRKNPRHSARKEYIDNFNKTYGNWILERNAVIKINDVVFVHGGISEKFSTWKLEDINNRARFELQDIRWAAMNSTQPKIPQFMRQIVYNSEGPLWYRDLARSDSPLTEEDVDGILENLGARYMVTAHTTKVIRNEDQMKSFNGKIWVIDTGISQAYRTRGGKISALIIENGEFLVWPPSLRTRKDEREKSSRETQRVIPYLAPRLMDILCLS